MSRPSSDALTDAVHNGIECGIRTCVGNECWGSAVILIYSGIDTMAFLGLPANQEEVRRADFIGWCNRYIRFAGNEQLTGEELYGARCGMLHTYGVESRSSRGRGIRMLGYMDRSEPPIRSDPKILPALALVSIEALAHAFFAGIDRFLVELFSDPARARAAEPRIKNLVTVFPIPRSKNLGADATT